MTLVKKYCEQMPCLCTLVDLFALEKSSMEIVMQEHDSEHIFNVEGERTQG
jgi:hypothetical protein